MEYIFNNIDCTLNFGKQSILYLLFCFMVWWTTKSYTLFLILTSYVHYIIYIYTYYIRKGINFDLFKRNVLLFKSIALIQLFYHYFFPNILPFKFDLVSILMILIGYLISVKAFNAIGIDRTYFGAELGIVENKWINSFPYGYIPHPMITSQIFALLGFMKAPQIQIQYPFLIPLHILFYVIHMLQEHFEIYRK